MTRNAWTAGILAGLGVAAFFLADARTALFFARIGGHPVHDLARAVSKLGLALPYYLLLAAGMLWSLKTHNRDRLIRFAGVTTALAAAGLSGLVLKMVLGRPRPGFLFQGLETGFRFFQLDAYCWSMPSGHAATVFSLTGAVSVLFPRVGKWLVFPAALIAASRIVVTAHFVSDVFAGAAWGLAVGTFAARRFQRYGLKRPPQV